MKTRKTKMKNIERKWLNDNCNDENIFEYFHIQKKTIRFENRPNHSFPPIGYIEKEIEVCKNFITLYLGKFTVNSYPNIIFDAMKCLCCNIEKDQTKEVTIKDINDSEIKIFVPINNLEFIPCYSETNNNTRSVCKCCCKFNFENLEKNNCPQIK